MLKDLMEYLQEKVLGKLSKGRADDVMLFITVFLEHLVKRHGKELGKCFKGYAGFLRLVSWSANAAKCAAEVVVLEGMSDCPHPVDAQFGIDIDL